MMSTSSIGRNRYAARMSTRLPGSHVALSITLALAAARPARADPEVAIETSPIAPVFRGAALAVRLRPAGLPHVAFSAGLYGFTLPRFFVDQTAGNADLGWHVAIRPAGHVAADYYLRDQGRGAHVGVAVVLARFALTRDAIAGSTAYASLYAVPRVGYTQRIWRGLYVTPSIGIEFHAKVGGATQLGDRAFEPLRVQPTLGLQLGYVVTRGSR